MDIIVGIDLGTTNSEIAIVGEDGHPRVLPDEDGQSLLPSVVGLDSQGQLLVGRPALNQAILAPERTIRSVKRRMGQEETLPLGERAYSPQEISAMILKTLKRRAERFLGQPVSKAVITVPAFFGEGQRQATRQAGELAGLEVVRIINEPTAAVLTYDPHPPERQKLLIYDLGGGTFDVSVAQVEGGVVEILASQGDNHLGGDDFDALLLKHVASEFEKAHGIDLREDPKSQSRLLGAVEEAKKLLSIEASAPIEEEFIAEKDGVPLNLTSTVTRDLYESLIEPLIDRTLACLDQAILDAGLQVTDLDRIVLVGGATRTPMVQEVLRARTNRPVHVEIEPDLAVAMGAAVQAGLIAGIDVGPILVDITPRTLGIQTADSETLDPDVFSPIINRHTPLPAIRTELYSTVLDAQEEVDIRVFQGESLNVQENELVGEFRVEGLAGVPAGNVIVVKLELDLDGILKVTATERDTGLAKSVTIENSAERFRAQQRTDAADRLDEVFANAQGEAAATGLEPVVISSDEGVTDPFADLREKAEAMIRRAEAVLAKATPEDAQELRGHLDDIKSALENRDDQAVEQICGEIDQIVFYLEGQ